MPYLVIVNTPGYRHSEEPSEFEQLDEARACAKEYVDEYLEQGYFILSSDDQGDFYSLDQPSEPWDLGIVVEVIQVDS